MKRDKIAKFASLITAILLVAGCASTPKKKHEKHAARLLVRLPASCNTPDGATLDAAGNIILSIPNFNNAALLKEKMIESPAPPKMVKIDKNNELIVINIDMPWEDPTGLLVNTKIDEPYTISVIPLMGRR